jgi:dihydropyrimidinase
MSRRQFIHSAGIGVAALAARGARASHATADGTKDSSAGVGATQGSGGLLIRNGSVVTAAGRFDADIRVRDGAIAELAPNLETVGERVIDARDLLVLPGGIDPHAHLTQAGGGSAQYRFVDDLTSGSQAALAGGITTIGNMTVPARDETVQEALARDEEFVRRMAIADILLHPVLLDPTQLDEAAIEALAEAGHTSVKIFMVIPSFDRNLREYVRVMRQAGAAGLMCVVHCEDPAIIAEATDALVAAGRSSLLNYADSRPVLSESIATRRAVAYCETTGAPIYVVHLSAKEPLGVCREAQGRGLPVYVETRPIYLHFTRDRYLEPDGPLYVGQPPLRQAEDVEALWGGIEDGSIHVLGSDTVGWSREQKLDPSLSVENLRPGVPNLQEMLPVFHSEGVVKDRISLERFVELTSTNAAKLFGLYPRKGTIAVGSDADLALWDPGATREIERGGLLSRAGFSLFEGWTVTGWPVMTVRRGAVVYEDGGITAEPGSGRVLRRGVWQPL